MNRIILIILSVIFITGCDENPIPGGEYEYRIDEFQTVNLSTQTKLELKNTNGDIVITGSDTAKNIYCNITKKVKSRISDRDAQSQAAQINISTQQNYDNIKLDVNNPVNDDREYQVNFNIILPNDFNQKITLGNGNISIDSHTKFLTVSLGNGNVKTDIVLKDTCSASISIGNGTMNLIIPDNTNAIINASIGNGNISNNGLNFQNQQISSKQFSGKLGNGVGKIVLTLGNGDIIMHKK